MIKVYYISKSAETAVSDSDTARRLLGYVLSRDRGIKDATILKDEKGKPYLDTCPGIHISITHTAAAIAVCVSDSPVGLDAETIGSVHPRVAERLFTESEREYVGDDPTRFFEIWTRKESLAKLTGEGITRRLADVDVLTGENTGGAVFIPIEIDGTAACVCTFSDDKAVTEMVALSEIANRI